jgi:hypothetical protein
MNELEKVLKEELEKEAVKHTQTDAELASVKSADEMLKPKWSKLYVIAAVLSFVILTAALIEIMLTTGGNGGFISNSEAVSGGGYQDSQEVSDTVSEPTSEDISEAVSEAVSEDISEAVSEDISEAVSEDISEAVSEDVSKAEIVARAEGDTFAEAHPDKIDIAGYNIIWHDDTGNMRAIRGSQLKIYYWKIIDGGSIAKIDNTTIIPDGVKSVDFTVCADGTDDEDLMRMKIYENGYIKYYTGTYLFNNDCFELYYNPKGYDLDKLFMNSSGNSGNDSVYLYKTHPEILEEGSLGEMTVTRFTDGVGGTTDSYPGFWRIAFLMRLSAMVFIQNAILIVIHSEIITISHLSFGLTQVAITVKPISMNSASMTI